MVRTAGSIFSLDTGSPLKRRIRRRYPPLPPTFTLVTLVTMSAVDARLIVTAHWYFDHDVTLTAGNEPELKIDNRSPFITEAPEPRRLICTYSPDVHAEDKWTITATPKNITASPAIAIPQDGIVAP